MSDYRTLLQDAADREAGERIARLASLTVIIGEEAHPTLIKSLGLLGSGRGRVLRVPVDDQGRMLASRLPRIEGPAIVCTQAGNINTLAFDPIADICDAVRPAGAWAHVDGAFGLWAAAVPELRGLAGGVGDDDVERSLEAMIRVAERETTI